jgi:hypothetical protein
MYHRKCWELAGKPKEFTKASPPDPNQGGWNKGDNPPEPT